MPKYSKAVPPLMRHGGTAFAMSDGGRHKMLAGPRYSVGIGPLYGFSVFLEQK